MGRDAAAVDLYKANAAVINQVLRHGGIVGALAAGQFDALAALSQFAVLLQRMGMKWLLQPQRPRLFQGVQAG